LARVISHRLQCRNVEGLPRDLRRWKIATVTIILVVVIVASTFLTTNWVAQKTKPQFYVGVEFAYAYDSTTSIETLVGELKGLADKVKDYTNLFVIGTPDITFNQTALNECCDYITKAGLSFIVLFTDQTKYTKDNNPFTWIQQAPQKYGDKFLAVYRFDEPGGNQLDDGKSQMVSSAENYSDAAATYESRYKAHLVSWQVGEKILTADYGLYWFDYQSGFDCILTEFGSNQSRQLAVGLCRGAAQAQGKDWGAIVTWTYTGAPYIENGSMLSSDLTLAYDAGAKYAVVFDYPGNYSQKGVLQPYGILQPEHFNALQNFWNYVQNNPQKYGSDAGKVAYVLPQDYGFGFRSADDTIWGLFANATLSSKIWGDVNTLITKYGSTLDIVYYDPEFNSAVTSGHNQLYFWNQTIS